MFVSLEPDVGIISFALAADNFMNFNKFDALEDVIIDSVLVYSNAAGVRTIQVVDAIHAEIQYASRLTA